jgi:hypothetical protein
MGIEPKGDALRRAVRWLSEHRDYSYPAVEEAARRFDLSPLDEEFLLRHFVNADVPGPPDAGEDPGPG